MISYTSIFFLFYFDFKQSLFCKCIEVLKSQALLRLFNPFFFFPQDGILEQKLGAHHTFGVSVHLCLLLAIGLLSSGSVQPGVSG
jgi:hypothetical protein